MRTCESVRLLRFARNDQKKQRNQRQKTIKNVEFRIKGLDADFADYAEKIIPKIRVNP